MRIVAVADTHLFTEDLEVPDGDLFLHAGDLCRGGNLTELAYACEWLDSLPHEHKVVIAGNHDRAFELAPDEAKARLPDSVIYLQDSGVEIEGIKIWGSPWQPEFHNWAFNLPRGLALREKWALIPDDIDILMTHGPPDGYGDRTSSTRGTGCKELRAALDRVAPRLHVFGHIHEDGGVWEHGLTLVANVTTWECDRAATVFDWNDGMVEPVVVPPRHWRDR